MIAEYITPFIDSTRSVLDTMLQMKTEFGKPEMRASIPSANHDVSGIISMSGDVIGSVVLGFPMDSAVKMVAKFVGMEMAPDSEDFSDAIGELVNMISGGAKAKFEGKSVSIGCPSIVIGSGHIVQSPKDSMCIAIPFSCESGRFEVEVSIKRSCLPASSDTATSAVASS